MLKDSAFGLWFWSQKRAIGMVFASQTHSSVERQCVRLVVLEPGTATCTVFTSRNFLLKDSAFGLWFWSQKKPLVWCLQAKRILLLKDNAFGLWFWSQEQPFVRSLQASIFC